MSDPIVETISANIATELAEIDGTGTWNQALTVIRPPQVDFGKQTWADLTVVLIQSDADAAEDTGHGLTTWIQKYMAIVFLNDGDNSTTPLDTRRNQVAADIEKKLKEDIRRGHENCWGTKITKKSPFKDPEARTAGVIVEFEVTFKTQLGNPYA